MAENTMFLDETEIEALPRFARVAFAARCARLVYPIFLASHFGTDQDRTVVRQAIERAEWAHCYRSDAHAAIRAAVEAIGNLISDPVIAAVVNTAKAAAMTAASAASYGSCSAAEAVSSAIEAGRDAARRAIAKDYALLRANSLFEKWTDDTPVPPEVFGPLWPDGVPEGWPVEDKPPAKPIPAKPATAEVFNLCVRAVASPGVSADVIQHHAVELFKALNEYSLEKYGRRLTKDKFQRLVLECTGAGVPS